MKQKEEIMAFYPGIFRKVGRVEQNGRKSYTCKIFDHFVSIFFAFVKKNYRQEYLFGILRWNDQFKGSSLVYYRAYGYFSLQFIYGFFDNV